MGRNDEVVNSELRCLLRGIEAKRSKCYLGAAGEMWEGMRHLAVVFDAGVVGESVQVGISGMYDLAFAWSVVLPVKIEADP